MNPKIKPDVDGPKLAEFLAHIATKSRRYESRERCAVVRYLKENEPTAEAFRNWSASASPYDVEKVGRYLRFAGILPARKKIGDENDQVGRFRDWLIGRRSKCVRQRFVKAVLRYLQDFPPTKDGYEAFLASDSRISRTAIRFFFVFLRVLPETDYERTPGTSPLFRIPDPIPPDQITLEPQLFGEERERLEHLQTKRAVGLFLFKGKFIKRTKYTNKDNKRMTITKHGTARTSCGAAKIQNPNALKVFRAVNELADGEVLTPGEVAKRAKVGLMTTYAALQTLRARDLIGFAPMRTLPGKNTERQPFNYFKRREPVSDFEIAQHFNLMEIELQKQRRRQ